MAAATRSRSSRLPPKPPQGPRPRELPRLPRADVASLWRLHALPPRRRSPAEPAASPPPNAPRRGRTARRVVARPRTRGRGRSRSPSPPRSSRLRPPAGKRARRNPRATISPLPTDGKTADEAGGSSGVVDVPPTAAAGAGDRGGVRPPPQLPYDVLVLVLGDAAALCPRSAFGCRLVSRGWREAATEPTVQEVVWRRCIGEEVDSADAETESESGVVPAGAGGVANAGVGGDRGEVDDGDESCDGGGDLYCLDVALALALIERDILGGRDRGRLDDGLPVRLCVERRWWRAAETLVRRCGAVDRHLSPYDIPDTYEDEMLDAVVDAGDRPLCLALLRCPQTAVGMYGWPQHAPASRYKNRFEGPPDRQSYVWHSVEALLAGRVELAAALVRPRDEGGGGQLPMPLLRALCSGGIPWTEEVRPALAAVERGMIGRRTLAHEMYKRAHDGSRRRWDSHRRKWDRYERVTADFIHEGVKIEVLICMRILEIVDHNEGHSELQAVLDRLRPIMSRPLEQPLDDVEGH